MVNQKPTDLGIPNRLQLKSSRFSSWRKGANCDRLFSGFIFRGQAQAHTGATAVPAARQVDRNRLCLMPPKLEPVLNWRIPKQIIA
jgi:hypothetical protein